MTDIVERLRFRADENYEMLANIHEPLLEAADEIERLRAALERIDRMEAWKCEDSWDVLWAKIGIMRDIARAALGGDK